MHMSFVGVACFDCVPRSGPVRTSDIDTGDYPDIGCMASTDERIATGYFNRYE